MGKILSAIRQALTAKGAKSRYRLSKETGIDPAALCRFMHNQRTGMGTDNAERLAEALGLRITIHRQGRQRR
jgi:hypothetical protein